MNIVKANAKALILLALIILAGIVQALGVDLGLDLEHYIALLLADLAVWAVPNSSPNKQE